jgi:hypothetical protein
MEINDLDNFSYTFNYRQAGNAAGAAPYMRIVTDANGDGTYQNGVDNSIVLDASQCGSPANPAGLPVAQGVNLTLGTANAKFRYNDDPCGSNAVQKTWDDIVAEHGTEKIVMVMVTHGYSQGTDVSSMLKNITLNGDQFNFTGAPADGTNGSNGSNGSNGTNGVNGQDGAAGPAGKDGVTTVVHVTDPETIVGASMRTLHVRKIAGMKFTSAKATMGGKKLTVKGRTIKVNLRNKPVGEYIVRMTAKFKAGGKTFKVHSIRSLNIVRK